MRPLATILKTVAALIACLIAATIVGAIGCTIVGIVVPVRFASGLLFYAAWLVIGVYCGTFAYNAAGAWSSAKIAGKSWSEQAEAGRRGNLILAIGGAVLIALALSYGYFGVSGGSDPYVPDNAPLTFVFLLATLGGMIVGRIGTAPDRGAQPRR
jgi:hypothetical protein